MANSTFSLKVAHDVIEYCGYIVRENMHIAIFEFHRIQANKLAIFSV